MTHAMTGARSLVRVLAVIATLCIAGDLEAQQATLTRARALELARHASPELRAAREAVAAARARAQQSAAYPNPTFSYSREQTSASGVTNAQNIAAVEQRVELGGVRSARRRAAEYRAEAAAARLASVDAQVRLQVLRAYAQLQAAESRALLAAQAAEAFDQARGISERRLAAGDVSGYAHRRIRLEAARYAVLRAEAELVRSAARVALATLLGELPDSLRLEPLVPEVAQGLASLVPVDSIVRLALASRPDLRALQFDARVAASDAQIAARERVPTPALSLGFKNESFGSPSETASGFVLGVTVPLPMWDRRTGAIAAAEAEGRQRLAEVEGLRRRIHRDVRDAYDAYRALAAQVDALRPQLGSETRQAMNAVQVAYSEGEVTLVEWLDAVRAFHEAEATLASLRAEAVMRLAQLEHAAGISLSPLPNGKEGT